MPERLEMLEVLAVEPASQVQVREGLVQQAKVMRVVRVHFFLPKGQAEAEAQVPLVNPVLPANQVTAATGCSPVFPALRFITQVVAAGAATVLLELVQGDWAAAVMGFSVIKPSTPHPALPIQVVAAALPPTAALAS
jgi:hypothetical protein